MNNLAIPIPEKAKEKIFRELEENIKDTLQTKELDLNKDLNFSIAGNSLLDQFIVYQKKYPDSKIDVALDSLKQEKTLFNRFLYTRAKTVNSFLKNSETRDQLLSELISYASVALFIFLPLFTLFLKLIYIRRKYTYVDHLIFVFHIQTVFFMLFSIFILLEIFGVQPEIWIFITLFLLYLFIAIRKFYNQGYFKTFLKFSFLNMAYLIISSIGISILLLISFALF